jgi:hypothetical protein
MKLNITLEQLETLLRQQKEEVINELVGCTSYYNSTNTPGNSSTLPIDKNLFTELGMKAPYPKDFYVLKKFLVE